MGKFAIGTRVRDDDGDEGVVAYKDGKYCAVEYDSGIYASVKKKWLTPVGGDVDLARAEVCKSDYSAPVDGGNSEWVPKVGDRVRVTTDNNMFCSGTTAGCEGIVTRVYGDGLDLDLNHPDDGVISQVCTEYRKFLEPITTHAPLTIELGKSYRTRDGRKVGPMVRSTAYFMEEGKNGESYPFAGDLGSYTENGRYGWDTSLDTDADLVAEWVEAEPASVAEAPATPERKFKVGDRVLIARNSRGHAWLKKYIGREFIISGECGTEDAPGWSFDGCGFWWPEVDLDLVTPTPPIGSTVTFTATGRLSAINENGHYQVTFPGLAPAQNSFALPAQYVTPAN